MVDEEPVAVVAFGKDVDEVGLRALVACPVDHVGIAEVRAVERRRGERGREDEIRGDEIRHSHSQIFGVDF